MQLPMCDLGYGLMGFVGSASGLIAQVTLPVPDDLKSWPATAMLTLIALGSMTLLAYQMKCNEKTVIKTAESLTVLAAENGAANRRLDEVAQKLGHTNDILSETNVQLKNRPCLKDLNQH